MELFNKLYKKGSVGEAHTRPTCRSTSTLKKNKIDRFCTMKLFLVTVVLTVLSVAFASIGDSLGDVMSSFRSATKDHVGTSISPCVIP